VDAADARGPSYGCSDTRSGTGAGVHHLLAVVQMSALTAILAAHEIRKEGRGVMKGAARALAPLAVPADPTTANFCSPPDQQRHLSWTENNPQQSTRPAQAEHPASAVVTTTRCSSTEHTGGSCGAGEFVSAPGAGMCGREEA